MSMVEKLSGFKASMLIKRRCDCDNFYLNWMQLEPPQSVCTHSTASRDDIVAHSHHHRYFIMRFHVISHFFAVKATTARQPRASHEKTELISEHHCESVIVMFYILLAVAALLMMWLIKLSCANIDGDAISSKMVFAVCRRLDAATCQLKLLSNIFDFHFNFMLINGLECFLRNLNFNIHFSSSRTRRNGKTISHAKTDKPRREMKCLSKNVLKQGQQILLSFNLSRLLLKGLWCFCEESSEDYGGGQPFIMQVISSPLLE